MKCDIFTVYERRGSISWGRLRGSQPRQQHPARPKDDDYWRGRARRVHASLRAIESEIFPRPKYFVTLIYPDRIPFRRLTRKTPKETKDRLGKLSKSFRDRYPDGYMLWSIEYVEGRGVHLHAACTPGVDITESKLSDWFSSHWWRICNFADERAVDVREYDYGDQDGLHGGYMTKFSKLSHKAALIECFGLIWTFGVVAPNNMPLQKEIAHRLNRRELEKVKPPLLKYIIQCRDDIRESSYSKAVKNMKIARLKGQYYKIKSDFCKHLFDLKEDLRDVVMAELHKVIKGKRVRAAAKKAYLARRKRQRTISSQSGLESCLSAGREGLD